MHLNGIVADLRTPRLFLRRGVLLFEVELVLLLLLELFLPGQST